MIYDCFSFFNELDILEIRLNTLNGVVDKFVLVEAPWTHTGNPKPLYFEENKTRFTPFLDKIIHIVASDPPVSPDKTDRENAWIRENWQRNEIKRGLNGAQSNDILVIADLDEIPHPQTIKLLAKAPVQNIVNLSLHSYAFFLNNRCVSSPHWTGGPQIISFGTFSEPSTYASAEYSEYAPQCANDLPSATLIRFSPKKKIIRDAGWHFSSVGGIETLRKKIKSFGHTEFQHYLKDDAQLEKIIVSGKGIFGFGDRYFPEPLEHDFPKIIQTHPELYSQLLIPASEMAWHKNALRRHFFHFKKSFYDKFIDMLIKLVPCGLHPLMRRIRSRLGL